MTKKGNQFYVFKRVDGGKNDVRVEDVRLERSYGLRGRPRASGETDFPIREGDLRKSMEDLLAEAGMRIDTRPRALTARESQATEDARTAAKKARRRAKAAEETKRNEALAAQGLPPMKTPLSKKKKKKMIQRKVREAQEAAVLEEKRKAFGPGFNELLERKRLSRKAKAESRRQAEEQKVVEDIAKRAAHRAAVASRRGGLRSAAGTRFEEALESVDLADDVGPMKDDGSEESAVWSSSEDDGGEGTSSAEKHAAYYPIAQTEVDELDELDDEDMLGPASDPLSTTPAMETPPETLPNVNDLLDEEAISMVLEQEDESTDDSSAEDEPMQDARSRIASSTTTDVEVDVQIPFMPSLPEPANRGESSNAQRRTSLSAIPNWRVYTQKELGLPRLGLDMPRKGASASQDYAGPSGRELHFEREWNGNKEHHVKNTCFSWPQLSNSASTTILSPTTAADIFHEVQTYYKGAFKVQDADPEVLGARGSRQLWVDLPSHMITGPIVSDSGNKGKRGLEIFHFTFAAALYMAGWLDHGFNFLYSRPTLDTGNVWPSPISRATLRLASPANDDPQGIPIEGDAEIAGPVTNAGNAGPSSNAQVQATAGPRSRMTKGLPAQKQQNFVSIEPKKPSVWVDCENNAAGSYCAVVCRIKIPGSTRRFRTVCILTTHRLKAPWGQSLPTCKALPDIEAVLATGQNVSLDQRLWAAAHDYTLALFSIPRKRQLHAIRGQLPYYVLPMSSGWQMSDEATSEVRFKDAVNVASNIGWADVFARIKKTTRTLAGIETATQGLKSLVEEALYQVSGSDIPYEVSHIARDAESHGKAQSRASGLGQQADTDFAIVDGPAFVLRPVTDVWSNARPAPGGSTRSECLCKALRQLPSLTYHSHLD